MFLVNVDRVERENRLYFKFICLGAISWKMIAGRRENYRLMVFF